MTLLLLAACAGTPTPRPGTDPEDAGDARRAATADRKGGVFDTLPDTGLDPDAPDVTVDCAGGGDFATIGEAFAASAPRTRIGVKPCTYAEDLDFRGKTLDVFGLGDAASVVIQGAVTLKHGESVGTRLAHLTLSGANGPAIDIDRAALRLDDVVLSGNSAKDALVNAEGGALEMNDVSIVGNDYGQGGMALWLDNGSLVGQRLTIEVSGGAYGVYLHNSSQILDSTLTTSAPYGIYVDGGEIHLRRSRVESPGTALWGGDLADTPNERMWLYNSALVGGQTAVYSQYMHVKADNDVFWGGLVGLDLQLDHPETAVKDSALIASGCGLQSDGTIPYEVEWTYVQDAGGPCGIEGATRLDADARFVAPPADFRLQPRSPLVDAGNPSKGHQDVDGTRNDVGMYGGPRALP